MFAISIIDEFDKCRKHLVIPGMCGMPLTTIYKVMLCIILMLRAMLYENVTCYFCSKKMKTQIIGNTALVLEKLV